MRNWKSHFRKNWKTSLTGTSSISLGIWYITQGDVPVGLPLITAGLIGIFASDVCNEKRNEN